jgi:NAD(P)-dependent dehydrogenase (short-subunit alcohol dehydrogenase family)
MVTGATGGLGRACALALARAGADAILVGRSHERLRDLADEIATNGGRARALVCDVTDAAAVCEAFAMVPPPAVLVTSVGANRPQPFIEAPAEALDWSLNVNVRTAFLTSQAAARRMIEAGRGGSIVHITSQMGHVGAALRSIYCTAKHAVEGLTKATALELAPHGIRVNAVAPTFVETPLTAPFLADTRSREAIVSKIPLGRLGTADEVAAAVMFAASPASGLMTGASLRVDGGWTAQ